MSKGSKTKAGWDIATLHEGIELHDKGASWPKVIEALGIKPSKFNSFKTACLKVIRDDRRAEQIMNGKAADKSKAAETIGDVVEREEDIDAGTVDLFTLSPRIKTVEEAIAKAEIDTETWEPATVAVKSYEMGCKIETVDAKGRKIVRGVAVTPMFAVTVKLKRKIGWNVAEFRQMICDEFRAAAPTSFPPVAHGDGECLAELSIPDHHFGKLCWLPETGNNYDLKIARDIYLNAANDLIAETIARYAPKRWLYVVGNDLLHVDLGSNTTTAGTRQDTDGRWQKAYLTARKCICEVTESLRLIAPVDILIVPGNHDEEKLFCLGDALECYFNHDDQVQVDNSPAKKKFYQYGKTLLGFQHGHKNKQGKHGLPLDMAQDVPKLWAETTHREIHCGHFHSEREEVWHFKRSESIGETIVRYLPSLCGTDVWHKDAGYKSIKAAECHYYHEERGRIGYSSTPPRQAA